MIISKIQEQILREIALCRFLKIEQINERFFSAGSLTRTRGFVNELIKEQYVKVIDTKQVGNRYLYGLDRQGVRYLRKIGITISYFPSEHESISNLEHLLITNNVVIAAGKLPTILPTFAVLERRHYLSNKQRRGKDIPIPDAWILLLEQERTHYAFWEELDRGTEEEPIIAKKVDNIIDFVESGAYEAEYGTKAFFLTFRTTKSKYRLQCLQSWVEKRLIQTRREQWRDFIHFSLIPEGPLNVKELFFDEMPR